MMHLQQIYKRSYLIFLAFTLLYCGVNAQNSETPYRFKTIVIDAGHGGKDPGNLGTGRYKDKEKDVALAVALMVGGYIEKQFPEIKVLFTRDKDVFIGLNERAELANRSKADLFISIHCNAFQKPTSSGVETWVLGLHRNKDNLAVAMKENSAIFLEDDYKTKYEGFDPNSAESIIALTMMQSAFLQQSLSLSSIIQKQFTERVGRKNRGVKQAGFLVLRKTTMPSILVELGFLTNADEEDFLNSDNGKAYMASAIFRGFKEYKDLVEDPLPEGYVPENENTDNNEAMAAVREQHKADSVAKAAEMIRLRAREDSLALAEQRKKDEAVQRQQTVALAESKKQARLKTEADSLNQLKQDLLTEFAQRQKEKADEELLRKQKLKTEADSLVEMKTNLLEEKKKREEELIEKAQKEEQAAKKAEEEKKKAEEAERVALQKQQEEAAQRAKDEARKKLEAIKLQKEQELAEALRKSRAIAAKDSLEAVKKQKEQELKQAELTAATDEIVPVDTTAPKSNIESEAESPKAVAHKAPAQVTIGNRKATTPEEAELLYLQLRKKQLEERIAQLTGRHVNPYSTPAVHQHAREVVLSQVDSPPNAEGVRLKIQIITSAKQLDKHSSQFKGQVVEEYQQGGLYKYTVGNTLDFEEITKLQGELRNLGFKGAFVVAFQNGQRIKVADARELLNNQP